jgi:hypothetical protein
LAELIPVYAVILALQAVPVEAAPAPPAPPPSSVSPVPVAPEPPRKLDDLSRPLTGAVPQGSYEERLRGAFSRTQSLQGPLDGPWMLKDATGAALYRVQLVDPGFSGGRLEGAWSDLRGESSPASSGFFAGVAREGQHLTLQFARAGAGLMVIDLDQRADGVYGGELHATVAGKPERTEAVTLVRP